MVVNTEFSMVMKYFARRSEKRLDELLENPVKVIHSLVL
jgi:hypothetical protein